ncbi:MAG: hypothetical protein ACI8X5_000350 [Planctomycetota bacterium]
MGSIPGVVSTRAAWHNKLEVVEVSYLPSRVAFHQLVDLAKDGSCTTKIFTTTPEQLEIARSKVGDAAEAMTGAPKASKDSDQLYYLKRSHLQHLPLTLLQARRVNGALGTKRDASHWLSPRQVELAGQVESILKGNPEAFAELERATALSELSEYEALLRKKIAASRE